MRAFYGNKNLFNFGFQISTKCSVARTPFLPYDVTSTDDVSILRSRLTAYALSACLDFYFIFTFIYYVVYFCFVSLKDYVLWLSRIICRCAN